MCTACRVCEGLSGWMHVHSLQSMRRLEWVDACVQLADNVEACVGGCMCAACRVCPGLSGWMHVHSLQSMRRVEWVDACVQLAENAKA